jgi:hypothetical protein
MNYLTPIVYRKEFKRIKTFRLAFSFIVLVEFVVVIGIIFMLTSYFTLFFSKSDIIRRLSIQEELLARRDLESLETKIVAINNLVLRHEKNEARRFSFSDVIFKIANATPASVSLTNISMDQLSNNTFVVSVRGDAALRDDFIDYLQELRKITEFATVHSPISNLLSEQDVDFTVDIDLSPEFYTYDAK